MICTASKAVILIVNQDPVLTNLISLACQQRRYQVDWLEESKLVLPYLVMRDENAGGTGVDLILIDAFVPSQGGGELVRTLRASGVARGIPMLIMARSFTPELVRDCYQSGANACVAPPSDHELLSLFLGRLLFFWLHVNARKRAIERMSP
jgi:CheY-like chemotaxis protein